METNSGTDRPWTGGPECSDLPMPMHLALVHRLYNHEGAVPLIVRTSARMLAERGVRCDVLACDADESKSGSGLCFHALPVWRIEAFDFAGFLFALRVFARLRRVHLRDPITCVVVHDSTAFYGAWLFGKLYRVPAILFSHGWIYSRGKATAYRRSVP